MGPPTSAPDADRFARLREAFHRLLEHAPAERERLLRALHENEPELATAVQELAAHLDERDLEPGVVREEGSLVGPFRLRRRLGRGGMGEVWLAERVEGGFEQRVALKRVHRHALSPDLVRRFLRERQILARLVHPHIAHLVDGGVANDGRPWLALEYVDGEPFFAWCNARGLDARARVTQFLPVCDAVHFAHRNLVVHCDLKPANLMIDCEGRPKLLDFGIARLQNDDADPTRTAVLMTPAYAAPEQRMGAPITTATDVYQLGAVLRELIGQGGHAAPVELRCILDKATTEAPAERYASVAMLASDLEDWLQGRPLRSGIGSRAQRWRKAMWRWRWPLASAAAVTMAVLAGALFAWHEARRAEASAREAERRFNALMSVVASANPGRYAGREPGAGELLTTAAERLRADFSDDPALVGRSLGEIGHGLMNLGHMRDAHRVIGWALAADAQMPQSQRESPFGMLKLFALSAEDHADALTAANAVMAAAEQDHSPTGAAVDALASAAGALARADEDARARAVLAAAQTRASAANLSPSARESYTRQAGWVALRAMRLDEARAEFARSRQVHDEHPESFSPLRRAELDLLGAEVDVLAGDARSAESAVAAARSVIEAEYPDAHVERAQFRLLLARLAILRSDFGSALREAEAAWSVLQYGERKPREIVWQALRALRAAPADCAPSAAQDAAPDMSQWPLHDRAVRESLLRLHEQRCAVKPPVGREG